MANKKKITENQLKTSKAGGALIGKRKGQTIIHNKGTLGGYAVGRLHSEGGIKGNVSGGGQDVEFQGGEVMITAPSVAMQQKQEFNGEMLTVRQILSKINVWGGGVSFAEGGEIPSKIKSSGKKYTYGGKLLKDHDIISSCGCQHEDALQAEEGKFENGGQMSDLIDPEKFNQAIKKSTFQIYDILVNEFDFGAFDGGCIIVANAIKKIIGGEIFVLVHRNNIADHAAVKIGNTLYDLDGAKEEKKFINNFNRRELTQCVLSRKINKKDLPDTPVNDDASQRIADIILSNAGEGKLAAGGEVNTNEFEKGGKLYPAYKASKLSKQLIDRINSNLLDSGGNIAAPKIKWTIEQKNNACKLILQSIGLDGSEFTRKDSQSSYLKFISDNSEWLCVRVSTHYENEARRQMCDYYLSIENSIDPVQEFNSFCLKNSLTFKDYTDLSQLV